MRKKQDKDEKNEISLEELIEEQRTKLGTNLTKITLETFSDWKKKKVHVFVRFYVCTRLQLTV